MEIVNTCINCISTANATLTVGVALIGLAVAICHDLVNGRARKPIRLHQSLRK